MFRLVRRFLFKMIPTCSPETRGRWRRTEFTVLTTFVLLEASQWLQAA